MLTRRMTSNRSCTFLNDYPKNDWPKNNYKAVEEIAKLIDSLEMRAPYQSHCGTYHVRDAVVVCTPAPRSPAFHSQR
jgi:hypothetical protein